MLLHAFLALASVALASAIPANKYQVIITRLGGQQPSVCSGALVAENMVLTSAQCVAQTQPEAMRVMSGVWQGVAHNVSRIHIHPGCSATTLYTDVALLQLQNCTKLAAENVRPIGIDRYPFQGTNCTVSFPRNVTSGLTQTVGFADVSRPCDRFLGRNLTTCTQYSVLDSSMCSGYSYELKIDHGTPLVCGGLLTGFLSNIVKGTVAVRPNETCSATAFYSRFDRDTSEWIRQVINGNKPNAPKIPARMDATHVTHWSGTGTIARPSPIGGAPVAVPVAVMPQRGVHQHHQQQNNTRTKGRRNGAVAERCSTAGVMMGMILFAVLNYV